jgi:hypothetical protein
VESREAGGGVAGLITEERGISIYCGAIPLDALAPGRSGIGLSEVESGEDCTEFVVIGRGFSGGAHPGKPEPGTPAASGQPRQGLAPLFSRGGRSERCGSNLTYSIQPGWDSSRRGSTHATLPSVRQSLACCRVEMGLDGPRIATSLRGAWQPLGERLRGPGILQRLRADSIARRRIDINGSQLPEKPVCMRYLSIPRDLVR